MSEKIRKESIRKPSITKIVEKHSTYKNAVNYTLFYQRLLFNTINKAYLLKKKKVIYEISQHV